MPVFSGPIPLAAAGTTGSNTGAAARVGENVDQFGLQFVVEAVGATPTVTYKLQGSLDGTNWFDLLALPSDSDTAAISKTVTATGATAAFVAQAHSRFVRFVRLVTSANTNVTYRGELYLLDRS